MTACFGEARRPVSTLRMACRGVSEVREPNLARSGAGKLRSLHRRLADISQRINLVSHTARTTGFTPVYDISEPFAAVGAPRDTALSRLNSELVDVGFVDEAIQCDPEVCAEIGDTYKFAGLDIGKLTMTSLSASADENLQTVMDGAHDSSD